MDRVRGRREVRSPLYMDALVASRSHPTLRAAYARLLDQGKPPKFALMRKILVTPNAMLRTSARWQPSPFSRVTNTVAKEASAKAAEVG